MRLAGLTVAGALGVAIAAAAAQAAPALPNAADHQSNIIPVAQGCGYGWHRNYFGDCVPNRLPIYRHRPDYVIEEWDEYDSY